MRKISISAHVVTNAEVKSSKTDGQPYLSLRVANNEFKGKVNNEDVYDTHYYSVTSFNKKDIALAKYFTKGSRLIIDGRYSDSIYTNPETNRVSINRNIIASDIFFNGEKHRDGNVNSNAQQAQNAVRNVQVTQQVAQPNVAQTNNVGDDDLPF